MSTIAREPGETVAPAEPSPRRGPFQRRDRRSRRVRDGGSIVRLVVLYMLAALGAFVVCALGLALAQRHAALQEAVRDAETTSALLATRVVQPALPDASLTDLASDEAFDRVVRAQVLLAPVARVRVLDETGGVLYSTDAGLVGQRVALSPAELQALRTSGVTASRDDGVDPTRLDGGRAGQSLDVGAGLRAPSGQLLLVQTQQPYQVVWLSSRALWLTSLPSLILALGLLYLVKIGFTYRLTRSLYGVQEGREQLLVTALAAADRERTLIAADLHDGVVQGLAGASYTLTDAANRSRAAGQADIADNLAETARSLRQWVRELRSLIVTVTPPALHSEGLRATLTDLVATLEARQIDVELDVRVSDGLSESAESLAYRVAQEGIRNVVRHARATKVGLVVVEEGAGSSCSSPTTGRASTRRCRRGARAASGSPCSPHSCTSRAGTCGSSPRPGTARPSPCASPCTRQPRRPLAPASRPDDPCADRRRPPAGPPGSDRGARRRRRHRGGGRGGGRVLGR